MSEFEATKKSKQVEESTQEMSAPSDKNINKRTMKIGESAFAIFFKENEFKYLKLYPYLSQVEKTLKMKEEFRRALEQPSVEKTTIK
jgi:hypothetical protein